MSNAPRVERVERVGRVIRPLRYIAAQVGTASFLYKEACCHSRNGNGLEVQKIALRFANPNAKHW